MAMRQRPRTFCKNQTSQNFVWVPKVPKWEKEFCYKIGSFKWERFLEAKKYATFSHSRVLEWNDSAAEEAFYKAKNRFFATINGHVIRDDSDAMNPDLYIDEIDWSSSEEEDAEKEEEEDEEEEVNGSLNINVPNHYHVRIEDIKPTGWDYKVEEFSSRNVLTGNVILSCCDWN